MSEHIFEGSGVAIITPMNPDGSVNFDELGRIIDFQIENGTDAIITCGTTGESATLNNEEHCEVIEYTIKKVAHRVPVIAGAGSNDTNYAIGLSKHAQTVGADAILSVTPYYNKTSQAGLIRHYTAIADNVDIPIILYNVPSRTGCNIKPETYYELSKHPNIKATKELTAIHQHLYAQWLFAEITLIYIQARIVRLSQLQLWVVRVLFPYLQISALRKATSL